MVKYCIIGAGVSGLTTAYHLYKKGISDFIILESRDRIGGRIHTNNHIDLGATWFQSYHTHLIDLMQELELSRFEQYNKDNSILAHSSMAEPHYFKMDTNQPSAFRIAGGSFALTTKLQAKFKDKIKLNTALLQLTDTTDTIEINTNSGNYIAEQVIITVPPKLALQLKYEPNLPLPTKQAMKNTHTWMSNAIKVGLKFKEAFWRKQGLSGTVISQISPVTELYDHSNYEDNTYALMGFVNESMRDETPENRKEQILSYLETYLGSAIRQYITYEEKDWSSDRHTTTIEKKPIYLHPQYGNPLFQESYMSDKLVFSGTETALQYGGYLEGAIYSGTHTAKKLLNK